MAVIDYGAPYSTIIPLEGSGAWRLSSVASRQTAFFSGAVTEAGSAFPAIHFWNRQNTHIPRKPWPIGHKPEEKSAYPRVVSIGHKNAL
jgi:hypothetical protein